MGEEQNQRFQLSFNNYLKVDSQGSRLTSDGGLVLDRELDERLASVISSPVADRLTAWEGRAVASREFAVAMVVRPLGGLRGR